MTFSMESIPARQLKIIALMTLINSGLFTPVKVNKLRQELYDLRNNTLPKD